MLSNSIQRNFSGALYQIDSLKVQQEKSKVHIRTEIEESGVKFTGIDAYNREKEFLIKCRSKNLYKLKNSLINE